MNRQSIQSYIDRAEAELTQNILPFWVEHAVDRESGGFYGSVTNDLVVDPAEVRGALLTSRILWTYSAAYKRYSKPAYLAMARWAFDDLLGRFWDDQYRGLYWAVDASGNPINMRKQIYGQAFGIYALTEYFGITGEQEALDRALTLFELIERHSYDSENQGYLEAFTREWRLEDDLRLSDVDLNEKKSMNTHLHILEAYTNLARVWNGATLKLRHRELIQVMMRHIIDPKTYRLALFFDERWHRKTEHVSFGHDIEASWLLVEAARETGDPLLLAESEALAVNMAQAVYDHGRDADGGLFYEADPSSGRETVYVTNSDKEWWPQAEAVVGFTQAYQLSAKPHFLTAALESWDFIERHLIDHTYGEWFRAVNRDGSVHRAALKVSFWKCPYHNGRACMEMIERLGNLGEAKEDQRGRYV